MIKRYYINKIKDWLQPGKVLVLYGPRQVGKTTLIQEHLKTTPFPYRLDSGDDIRIQELFTTHSLSSLKDYAQGYELIVIDEAQRIPNIGMGLKILVDHLPQIRILVTGSASFDLAGKIGEPLTGRKLTKILYPIAQQELHQTLNRFELKNQMESYLIYGSYPEVLQADSTTQKKEILHELVGSYLLKDVLELERVKSSKILLDLLKLLCFQVGKDTSLSELAGQLGIDYKTVARYLDLLEKAFVIRAIPGFSRNLRKEIAKSNRYLFLDNGIRNAIISNFNSLNSRDDVGLLWENFLANERLKKDAYTQQFANYYFWRTYDQKKIDLIEETGGKLHAFEFKFKKKEQAAPRDFLQAYPGSPYQVIHQENYLDFVLF